MERRLARAGGLVLGLGLMLAAAPAFGLINRLTPLTGVLEEAQYVLTVQVEVVDASRPAMILAVEEDLKGKAPFRKLPVHLKGDREAARYGHTPQLLKRVAPKLPLVLFVCQRDKDFTAFAYTNGTWFQMAGVQADDTVRWSFTHCEPYLRKTFKGPTAELRQVVVDALAGKKKPPAPDAKEKPGLGPEVKPSGMTKERRTNDETRPANGSKTPSNDADRSSFVRHPAAHAAGSPESSLPISSGPPFAVIPTVVLGAPLALLALLFPAVLGGLILVLRRWAAALTVLSANSTLFVAQTWFAPRLLLSWWGTPLALWLAMTVVTLLGVLWAWRRHVAGLDAIRHALPEGSLSGNGTGGETLSPAAEGRGQERSPLVTMAHAQASAGAALAASPPSLVPPGPSSLAPRPSLGEVLVLGASSLISLGAMAYWLPHSVARLDLWGKMLLMFSSGLWVAALHAACVRWLAGRHGSPRPALPGEGVMLWGMVVACAGLGATMTSETAGAAGGEEPGAPYRVVWRFKPATPCWIASSPLVDGDLVYVGVVHGSAFRTGAVYCLDRATGKPLWVFNNGGKMKDVFSSPHVADGRLYVGEGFHQDLGCKLYCLEAHTGKKLWDFQTESHTEATPCVWRGKVYFGAGDDGLFCLDAATGKESWHLKGLHVDANPLVIGGRLYGGSGVGDAYKDTALFCLDAETGAEHWRVPTDLPVWGMPALDGAFLYAGIGNGNFMESAEKPAGAVLCLEAATGKRLWQYDARDGVLGRVAVDVGGVYFGSRDKYCYGVHRKDGKLRWKQDLGSPVVASPALAEGGRGSALYVVASGGRVCRLDPVRGGAVEWTFDVGQDTEQNPVLFSSPAVAVSHAAGGERRRLYFGSGLQDFSRGILYCLEDLTSDKVEE
jgi:outer membrane protein assembly factor BamB